MTTKKQSKKPNSRSQLKRGAIIPVHTGATSYTATISSPKTSKVKPKFSWAPAALTILGAGFIYGAYYLAERYAAARFIVCLLAVAGLIENARK